MAMKTPGVYIVEKNAFPNSVVEVATAVPAFIGHTAHADNKGEPLTGKPWRISSMSEFELYFGGPPQPVFRLEAVAGGTVADVPDLATPRGQQAIVTCDGQTVRVLRAAGRAGGRFLLHQAMTSFFANGGGPCYVVSVGGYADEIAAGDAHTGLIGGLTPLLKEQEPTMVVVPDAVLLSRVDCMAMQQAMLHHCGQDMRNRIAILDIWGGDRGRDLPAGDCIDAFRQDIGPDSLSYGAAYHPWLHMTPSSPAAIDWRVFDDPKTLAALVAAELKLDDAAANDSKVQAKRALLDELAHADASKPNPLLHASLMRISSLYLTLLQEASTLVHLTPPSAIMAGIYTSVDNARGVWKAPANVGVNGALGPAVHIGQDEQEDLNVHISGLSINALRSFIGQGLLVWGARTLDGNRLDWRYVNVRRTMIMLEESCRLAAKAMVFEPNVANTWVTVKSMIANFLTGIWKRGGLAGATSDDAFSVHIGLGETMTAQDVLDGVMRVTVLVALTRPAEFVEITFQQQMQKG